MAVWVAAFTACHPPWSAGPAREMTHAVLDHADRTSLLPKWLNAGLAVWIDGQLRKKVRL